MPLTLGGNVRLGPAITLSMVAATTPLTLAAGQDVMGSARYLTGAPELPKPRDVFVILGDSALRLHECSHANCRISPNKPYYAAEPLLVISYARITDMSSSADEGKNTQSRQMLGAFVGSGSFSLVAIEYETDSDAEAVVLRTETTTSAPLIAKLKFRVKKFAPVKAEPAAPL